MPLDIDKYRHFTDSFDLSEKQKDKLIQDVWSILESFVDQAFGLHPTQLCHKGDTENSDLQGSRESLESKVGRPTDELSFTMSESLENADRS